MTAVEALHALPEEVCWQLLASRRLGRLAVVVDGAPQVFPVNYAPAGRRLVFRSGPGTKLDAALAAPSAFEVDSYDDAGGAGWSVLLQGTVATVADGPEDEMLRAVAIFPAPPGDRPLLLVFTPSAVTGRRFSWGAAVPPFP